MLGWLVQCLKSDISRSFCRCTVILGPQQRMRPCRCQQLSHASWRKRWVILFGWYLFACLCLQHQDTVGQESGWIRSQTFLKSHSSLHSSRSLLFITWTNCSAGSSCHFVLRFLSWSREFRLNFSFKAVCLALLDYFKRSNFISEVIQLLASLLSLQIVTNRDAETHAAEKR